MPREHELAHEPISPEARLSQGLPEALAHSVLVVVAYTWRVTVGDEWPSSFSGGAERVRRRVNAERAGVALDNVPDRLRRQALVLAVRAGRSRCSLSWRFSSPATRAAGGRPAEVA